MKKQTAVEWLYGELSKNHISNDSIKSRIDKEEEIWKQAKAMEREQIIKAFCEGYDHDGDNYDGAEISYYNRTYKGGEQ
jgi:hypothetical protein